MALSAHLKGVLHLLREEVEAEQDTKVVEEAGVLRRSKEAVEVMAVVVVAVDRNSNTMVEPLNIKAGEGEGHPSLEVVVGMVVVVVVLVWVVVAAEDILVAQPDLHKFPSYTKQPQLLFHLG